MADAKPQVIYFGAQELVDLVVAALSPNFEVTGVTGVTALDAALDAIRQNKPDYVLIDPRLSNLDQQQLHRRLKADPELAGVQILVVRDGSLERQR